MKKVNLYIKRSFCFVLCLLVLAFSVMPRMSQPRALIPELLAQPDVAAFLLETAIALGLVYETQQTADTSISDIWAQVPEAEKTLISTAAKAGRWLYDPISGAAKYVVDVSDEIWNFLKDIINAKYDVGENNLIENSEVELPLTPSGYVGLFDGVNSSLPMTFHYYLNYTDFDFLVYYEGNQIKKAKYVDGELTETLVYSNPVSVEWLVLPNNTQVSLKIMYNINAQQVSTYNISGISDAYYGSSVVVGDVIGLPDAVDNPNYDWYHPQTEKRSICAYPATGAGGVLQRDLAGDIVIDYTGTLEKSLGKTASDLADIDVVGIPLTDVQDIPKEGVIDTPVTPDPGSEGQTSLKALFFSKFPFCLPWDIKNAFMLLSADPEAPEWEIDILQSVKGKYGITGDTTIRINMDDFEIIGQLSRWTCIITFTLALIVLTRKIIKS